MDYTDNLNICESCGKQIKTYLLFNVSGDINLCKKCTYREIIKNILRNITLPLVMLIIFYVLNVLLKDQPTIFRSFLIWIIIGLPFGTKFMFKYIPINFSFGFNILYATFNVLIGSLIGGTVAIHKFILSMIKLFKTILLLIAIKRNINC